MGDSVWEKIGAVVGEIIGEHQFRDNNVTEEGQIFDYLYSLDFVEMIMKLEDVYDIEISDEEAEKWKTFKDVVDYINTKV